MELGNFAISWSYYFEKGYNRMKYNDNMTIEVEKKIELPEVISSSRVETIY